MFRSDKAPGPVPSNGVKSMSQQTYEKINRSLALSMQQQKFQLAKALHDNVAIRAENQRLLCRIRQLEAVDDEARFTLLLNETVEKELQRIRESVAEVVAIIGDNTERLSALFDKRQKAPTPNRTSVLSQLRRSRRKTNGGGDALMPIVEETASSPDSDRPHSSKKSVKSSPVRPLRPMAQHIMNTMYTLDETSLPSPNVISSRTDRRRTFVKSVRSPNTDDDQDSMMVTTRLHPNAHLPTTPVRAAKCTTPGSINGSSRITSKKKGSDLRSIVDGGDENETPKHTKKTPAKRKASTSKEQHSAGSSDNRSFERMPERSSQRNALRVTSFKEPPLNRKMRRAH